MKTSRIVALAMVCRSDFYKLKNHPSKKVRIKFDEIDTAIINNEGTVPSYLITGYAQKIANKLCGWS